MRGGGLAGKVGDAVLIETICGELSRIAPLKLAEDWDNVGLLVGDRRQQVTSVMTCLTLTLDVVEEAVEQRAGLVVAHHPIPFRPVARLTTDSTLGKILCRLMESGIAVYSAHTAYDSATGGINDQWAEILGLTNVQPLIENRNSIEKLSSRPEPSLPVLGSGRFGDFPEPRLARDVMRMAASAGGSRIPRLVGPPDQEIRRVGIACGSGGSFLDPAKRSGCQMLLTGEATFHTCLDAAALEISLGLLGHFASERFAMERFAVQLADTFPALRVWASQRERDPIEDCRVEIGGP